LRVPLDKFPLGKLPPEILARVLDAAPVQDRRVLLGPGVGLDCAVIDLGSTLLVFKSDPITFATDEIGWYAVQVNANDIATTGAAPAWFLMSLLLPDGRTDAALVEQISQQVFEACEHIGASVIGGHTEITHGLERPIVMGTLIGEVSKENLVTPRGACPGDRLLLTKGIPIEATAILAREFPEKLRELLDEEEIAQASNYLFDPGISVLKDAQLAVQAGSVTAMHDPTEGGLAAALWELAEACGMGIVFDPESVPVPELAKKICRVFEIDPLGAIASGALLLAAANVDSENICRALEKENIPCVEIGWIEAGEPEVWQATNFGKELLEWPKRDEIARIFDSL
jgi:hydrogenase expression/formation protein HypE